MRVREKNSPTQEYVAILTADDQTDEVSPADKQSKPKFNPLVVMNEVFYQVTNFNNDMPQSNLDSGKKYSFVRKNLPHAPSLEYLKTKRSK